MQKLILKIHSQGIFIKTEEIEFVRTARKSLEKESTSRKLLGVISAELGMKYNTFRKYYSEITGDSPGEYQLSIAFVTVKQTHLKTWKKIIHTVLEGGTYGNNNETR